MFEAWVVRANECSSKRHDRSHDRHIFSTFYNMKVCCVFSLELLHGGDSNEYTQFTIFNMKKEKHPKNEFKTAVVNEPSVFEPLKFYCIPIHIGTVY